MYDHYLGYPPSFGGTGFAPHASPFWDIASQYTPRTIKDALRWAEYLYCANSTYRIATNRIARYLITELDIVGQHNTTITRYNLFFDKLQIRRVMATLGITVLTYGNAFMSVALPFDRILRCPSCKLERPARSVEYEFINYEYVIGCPCGYHGAHDRLDKYSNDVSRTRVVLWDPKLFEINRGVTGECEYWMHIDVLLKHKVQNNNKFILDTTPWELIEAIKKDQLFKFAPNNLLHVSTETLPGFNIEWGIPSSIALFKLHYLSAILRKAKEAIALDYIVPLRTIFPTAGSADADPIKVMGLQKFVSRIEDMLRRHREDPGYVQVSPVPLGYQAIGGEGKAIDIGPELKAVDEELLNGAGFPAELFYGTMQLNEFPTGLRLFENTWDFLYYGYNNALQFIANKVGNFFAWEPVTVKFLRVTIADDIERRQILMQVAAAGQGSQTAFFKAYNMDWSKELEKMFREQYESQEIQKRVAEDYKMQQQVAQEGGGRVPQDIRIQAQQLAQQALGDPMNSRQLLNQLHQSDEMLYSMVKMYMDRFRNQASSQAGRQALQQGLMASGAGGVTGSGVSQMPPPMGMPMQ